MVRGRTQISKSAKLSSVDNPRRSASESGALVSGHGVPVDSTQGTEDSFAMELDELLARTQRLELKSKYLARSMYAGLYRSAFRGQGMECTEVREYVEGDDIRLIDWNVSARSQSLYVKKMVEERERNVIVVLDVSGSLRFGSIRRTKFDLLLELGSIFVLSGYYTKDRVSLAIMGSRVELFVPPAKGWTHAVRLIREMASRRPAGHPEDLEQVWKFLNSPGVPRSLILLLTDFTAPLSRSNNFSIAGRKHEIVAVLVSDPREWKLPVVGRIRLKNPETGEVGVVNTSSRETRLEFESAAQKRRRSVLSALELSGADWVEFSTGEDYEAPLRHFLESRVTRKGYRRP